MGTLQCKCDESSRIDPEIKYNDEDDKKMQSKLSKIKNSSLSNKLL